jgi:transposase InsO family protein
MCKYFGVSKSGYYKHLHSNKTKDDALRESIKEIQVKCKFRYGYRRVQIALARKGSIVNHKRVLRVMSKYNLLSKIRRKYIYLKASDIMHKYQNILAQDFKTTKINHKWTTDISYIITPEGRLYLSVIRDACDGYVVAYKYSTRQDLKLVADTVREALSNHKAQGAIIHSDQGFQYTSQLYNQLMIENNLTPSMSRKATPLDNAPIESFFSAFKSECIYLEKPKTIQDAKELIDEYIDFYNFDRLQLKQQSTPHEIRQQKISHTG